MRLCELINESSYQNSLEEMIANFLAMHKAKGYEEIPTSMLMDYLRNMGKPIDIDDLVMLGNQTDGEFSMTQDVITLEPDEIEQPIDQEDTEDETDPVTDMATDQALKGIK